MEMAVSSPISIGSSLDDNPISSSLDLTSDIIPRSLTKPLNQSIDWQSKENKSPNIMPKILPLKMKFSTKGKKAREAPKEAPKRAKKKETKGWATLTSEIDHENQKTEEKRWILKTP